MTLLVGLLMILLFYQGYSLMVSYMNQDPDKSTNRVYKKSVETKSKFTDKITERYLLPLTKTLAKFIKVENPDESKGLITIEKIKYHELKSKLDRVGIPLTPSEYYARPFAAVIMLLPLLLLAIVTGVNMVTIGLLGIGCFAIFMKFFTEVDERLREKRKEIEKELPNFIRSIVYKLNDDPEGVIKADLISTFEDYAKVGKSIFRYDINRLIMDMKSKDMETALRAMDARICIPEVSFLCDALIALTRGEHQGTTLEHLAHDMDLKAIANIEKEISQRPGKMRRAAIPMFIITFIAYAYVLVEYSIRLFYQIM